MATQRRTRANLLGYLRSWYHDTVVPFLTAERTRIDSDATSSTTRIADLDDDRISLSGGYGGWASAIDVARSWLRDPSFTVAPELASSRVVVAHVLRDLYTG